jgi:glycosyltransferase involved in cell wall biosynthesis
MAWKLLLPWLTALIDAGYEVHLACTKSSYFDLLVEQGFHLHDIPIRRRLNPLTNFNALWRLYRLVREGQFDLVNTHSPVAAALGRIAGWFAGAPVVVYTVHGFYFHDDMPRWKRRTYILVERLLGRLTDYFMFVSEEDRKTAICEGIATDSNRATTIFNGVDLTAYPPRSCDPIASLQFRRQLNIPDGVQVVGIVGRVVREKGYLEFAEMASWLHANRANVFFLVVGDTLASDRDGVAAEFGRRIDAAGLRNRVILTGFTDRVSDYLEIMDVFVLPSYREGFPRSVLEAMSTALPVVTTNIRGCREAVVDGVTGLIVPPRNGRQLAEAVNRLLEDPHLATRMGKAGRERVVNLYSHKLVQRRFVETIAIGLSTSNVPRHVDGLA